MRRLYFVLALAALGLLTSSADAQYYYPPMPNYGAMPVQYGYGQPAVYPMMARPVYYPPAPVMRPAAPYPVQYQPQYATSSQAPVYAAPPAYASPAPAYTVPPTRVNTYGPVVETPMPATPVYALPAQAKPVSTARPNSLSRPVKGQTTSHFGSKLFGGQPQGNDVPVEVIPGAILPGEVPCGPEGCGPQGCGPVLDPAFVPKKHHARGHWVGQLGVYFLVPTDGMETAYRTTTGTTTTTTEFPREVEFAPRVSVAYIAHNGWGVRGNFWYLSGSVDTSATNTSTGTIITAANGTVLSPSTAAAANIFTDLINVRQSFTLYVGDLEAVKEHNIHDTTFLVGLGARYARFENRYTAARTTSGTVTSGQTIGAATNTSSVFEGVGPTLSVEVIHPLTCWGLSFYASGRGSVLWGDYSSTTTSGTITSTAVGGTVTNTAVPGATSTIQDSSRTATIAEVEAGLQFGHRVGPCYLFSRVGGVYQRWMNVGSATNTGANVTFLGGTVMMGITY